MRAVIGIGIEEEDRKHTWMEDADSVSAAPWAGARGAAGGPVGWGPATSWLRCSLVEQSLQPQCTSTAPAWALTDCSVVGLCFPRVWRF